MIMKRLLVLLLLAATVVSASAQRDVTKFLGIPVDGTKAEMIQKLRRKGFAYDAATDILSGEFNGDNAYVYIVTNHDKVWRIMVKFADTRSETGIRISFNRLCQQMMDSEKYSAVSPNSAYIIPSTEEIGYELRVHDKRYEAAFTQVPETVDSAAIWNDVYKKLREKYSDEDIKDALASADEPYDPLSPPDSVDKRRSEIYMDYILRTMEEKRKNSVWFMISESYGMYSIVMYYDNEYNHASGEDL